jgi:hypothetical protein
MRFLNVDNYELYTFYGEQRPQYAILSHTWGEGEITFTDIQNPNSLSTKNKAGYDKIVKTCGQAKSDNFQYAWVDTCCINKSSSAELSEAINSMYQWYKESAVCYAYLADVVDAARFTESRWFTRGWTLQELIAPMRVIFFDAKWHDIGTKDGLSYRISERTGIPRDILQMKSNFRISVAQKMSWASQRETTRVEDMAYCLLGIFDVNMPLLYGEGSRAFKRLQGEILRQSNDQSLLAWYIWTPESDLGWHSLDPKISLRYPDDPSDNDDNPNDRPNASRVDILAHSPKDFEYSGHIESIYTPLDTTLVMTNGGLRISMQIVSISSPDFELSEGGYNLHVGLIHCAPTDRIHRCIGIPLIQTDDGVYHRVVLDKHHLSTIPVPPNVFVNAVSKEILISNTTSQKAIQYWQELGRMEESILFDAAPEVELDVCAALNTSFRDPTYDRDSNAVKLKSAMDAFFGRLHDIVIILYSSAYRSVLTILLRVPNAWFHEEKIKPIILLRTMESDDPASWDQAKLNTHCRDALKTGYYERDTESSTGSRKGHGFAASLETREIVNQRIYLVRLMMQDLASESSSNDDEDENEDEADGGFK